MFDQIVTAPARERLVAVEYILTSFATILERNIDSKAGEVEAKNQAWIVPYMIFHANFAVPE